MNAMAAKKLVRVLQMIEENKYTISRTGKIKFYDFSLKRASRQAIGN